MKRKETIEQEVTSLKSQLGLYNVKWQNGVITEKVYLFYKHVYEDTIKALEWVLESEENNQW